MPDFEALVLTVVENVRDTVVLIELESETEADELAVDDIVLSSVLLALLEAELLADVDREADGVVLAELERDNDADVAAVLESELDIEVLGV